MKVKYTKHALVSLEERGIKKNIVEETLKTPGQVIKGGANRETAQSIFKRDDKDFLFRVIYTKKEDSIKVITAYWTSKIDKYWEGKK